MKRLLLLILFLSLGIHPAFAKEETVTLGGGCFWCIESVFEELRGVKSVVSGYSGGNVENPTYRAVCSGSTGHAEVVQVTYDPAQISLADLMEIFFALHDPTQLNRQGPDTGTQYRSVAFYRNDKEKAIMLAALKKAQGERQKPIVTQVEPLKNFYAAEKYHQDYFNNNPSSGYCQININPKLDKLRKKFASKLKR